jgi:hypothetical protein
MEQLALAIWPAELDVHTVSGRAADTHLGAPFQGTLEKSDNLLLVGRAHVDAPLYGMIMIVF